MYRPSLIVRVSLSGAALFMLIAACGDDGGAASAGIRDFCTKYVNSPAFACCAPTDKRDPAFGARYRFSSVGDCTNRLSAQESSSSGRQTFDGAAAASCTAYLDSRDCNIAVTKTVALEEQNAGCSRVLTGVAEEGQQCQSSDDCKLGLVCPPVKETGLAFCAKPATINQDCYGQQADSVDHPACGAGLFCSFVGENPAGCPSPPCRIFKCVPPFEVNEPCTANECAKGLVCRDGTCQQGEANGVGGGCRVLEHCKAGLYCDAATGKCADRKAEGAECSLSGNGAYECKGICKGTADPGTCAAFCGQ